MYSVDLNQMRREIVDKVYGKYKTFGQEILYVWQGWHRGGQLNILKGSVIVIHE